MSYEEQLSAARFRAERDQARQECERLRARLRDSVPREAYERKRAAWLRQIRECETALGRRRDAIARLASENDALRLESAQMRPRLMPEGMEWPKYTDGEPARIGGFWESDGCDTSLTYIERIIFAEDGVYLDNDYNEAFYRPGERVKRPAPKVLDADGAEIREGDTLYLLPGDWCDRLPLLRCREWDAMRVLNLSPNHDTGRIECETLSSSVLCYPYPSQLTHQRPVLDAGGVSIKGGDTIYSDGCKEGLIVDGYQHDGSLIAHKRDGSHVVIRKPQHFTHAKPEIDTWERIEEDAGCTATKYNERRGTIFTTKQQVARDLVRRCRALAERERGE